VIVGGGADVVNRYLIAGLVDEIELHVDSILLGSGARLVEGVGPGLRLEQLRAVDAPGVAHLEYRVVT
jgi:riboflavin biosynthesis pyrimidine reductase